MSTVAEGILAALTGLPEGAVVSAKEMLHLGSRAAVDQALSRLARSGRLMRLSRGTYVLPVESRFGARAPSPSKVVESITAATGEAIVPHGAAAANKLGLTTQVPVRQVFVTSGRGGHLRFGSNLVEIQHVPKWQMVLAGRPAGDAVRAMAWLGREKAPQALAKLRHALPREEWKAISSVQRVLPSWLAKAVSEAVHRV